MSNKDQPTLSPSSCLRQDGERVEVEVISNNLTPEQSNLVVEVKQLKATDPKDGVQITRLYKFLRDSFAVQIDPIYLDYDPAKAWGDFVCKEFQLKKI